MPIIQFENGQKVQFDGNPTPADIDHVASQLGITANKTNQSPDAIADQTINSRPSAIADLTKNPTTMAHPVGAVLRTIRGGAELMQGVPASIALDLQRGKPQDILPNLGKVVTGQRPAQYGDVFKGAGVPGPIASAAGLATDVALTPGGVEGVAGLGKGAVKVAQGGAKAVGNFFNFDQKAITLSEKVRGVAAQAKQAAIDQFGNSISSLADANPTKAISLQEVVDGIKGNPDLPYEAKSVFNKTPILRDLLKNPGDEGYMSPSNVSLKDTQEIINYINTKIPRSIKSTSLDILDAQNDIRAAQLDAFPEMEGVRQQYGKFAEDYKLIKSALNPKATPGAIASNFANNPVVKAAANRVLAPVVKDMSQYRNQVGLANFLKKAGIGIVGVGATVLGGGKVYDAYRKIKG